MFGWLGYGSCVLLMNRWNGDLLVPFDDLLVAVVVRVGEDDTSHGVATL